MPNTGEPTYEELRAENSVLRAQVVVLSDRAAVIDAVIAEQLAVLHHQLDAAAGAAGNDPVRRLHAICCAYTSYARTHPTRYRVLVGRRFADDWQTQNRAMDHTAPLMAATVELVTTTIQNCIDIGACTSTDAWTTTAILWFTLHGLVTVPQAITSLDWPPFDQLLTDCITRTVGLHSPPAHPKPPQPSSTKTAPAHTDRHPSRRR